MRSITDWKNQIKKHCEEICCWTEKLSSIQERCETIFLTYQKIMAFEQKYEEFKKEITTPLVSDEERVEIIILDHENSRDMTLECLKCILEKVQYPIKITVYDNTLNSMNTAKIWNKLIKQSTCGYVLIMDNDAFAQNDFVSEMVRAVERHTNAAVVGPVAGDKSVTTCQEIQPIDKPEEEVDGHISGYCMLFRRKIFDEFRYFDEDFMFYGQESDWMQEIIEERKYRIYVVPRAYVKHGIAGEASISSMRKLNQGGFDRGLDAEYSEMLFHQKKELRKQKRNESNVCG